MTNRFKFTKTTIERITPPAAGSRATYYDATVPKLALRVTATGTKTFYVIKRASREMVWFKLGAFPDMTVEQAQNEANATLGAFAREQNPAAARRTARGTPTLAQFFKEYGERHGAKKRAWKDDQQRFRDYLEPTLGARKITEVSKDMLGRVLSNMERKEKAPATINNVRALASGIFGKAIEWSYLTDNPVRGIATRRATKRDRFLQASELPRFFAAIAEESNETIRDYFLVSLLTGARRANVLAMRWTELDLRDGLWRIARTKNGDPQNVTLSPEAVLILKSRQETAGKAEYVFPGDGASGHLVEPKKGWARVLERAGISDLRIHDLRRTLGSWQAKTGASLAIIGKSLNHKNLASTAIYARLDLDPVRQSVNTATAAMMELAGMKPVGKVVVMRGQE